MLGDAEHSVTAGELHFRHLQDEGITGDADLVDQLAPLIVEASRPFADWYFGSLEVAEEVLREWIERPDSEVAIKRALVVEAPAGTPCGCLIGLPGDELAVYRRADFAAFCDDLGSGEAADEVIADVVQASNELFPAVEPTDLYISRVAVSSSHRGRGIGRALVAHAMDTFSMAGYERFRLDVSAGNRAAIGTYAGLGWTVESENESPTSGLTYLAMRAVAQHPHESFDRR